MKKQLPSDAGLLPSEFSPKDAKIHLALLLQQKMRLLAKENFYRFFIDFAWPVLQPGTPYKDNWHIKAIAEHLQALADGQIRHLVINMPFRMLKSTLVSQSFPAWEWIRSPHLQYLTASYAKDVATRDAVDSRRIIESAKYQQAYSDVFRMTSDQNVKTRYENDHKGSRIVTSTDSAGTGFGGNRVIIDDPVSSLEADNDLARQRSIEWYRGTASTRLNNAQTDSIIVVHQRFHPEDLTGYVLKSEGDGWEHLILPMRYDPKIIMTKSSLGFKDPRTKMGELLHPDRLNDATVAQMEIRLGTYHVAAQLQQNPSLRQGSIFKRQNWRFYKGVMTHENVEELLLSVDCTFKDKVGSDSVAIHVWGKSGARFFLLDRVCEPMGFNATKLAVRAMHEKWPTSIAVLVEDKANGSAVIEDLVDTVPGILPIEPQGGKVARANTCEAQHEAGQIWLPDPEEPGNSWVLQFIETFAAFPDVKHDDDVDATTQALNWWRTKKGLVIESNAPVVAGGRTFN
jgi:predicted phage terminase large subunit-like protein